MVDPVLRVLVTNIPQKVVFIDPALGLFLFFFFFFGIQYTGF